MEEIDRKLEDLVEKMKNSDQGMFKIFLDAYENYLSGKIENSFEPLRVFGSPNAKVFSGHTVCLSDENEYLSINTFRYENKEGKESIDIRYYRTPIAKLEIVNGKGIVEIVNLEGNKDNYTFKDGVALHCFSKPEKEMEIGL